MFYSTIQVKVLKPLFFALFMLDLLMPGKVNAQSIEAYPPYWWVGMEHEVFELMVAYPGAADLQLELHPPVGVKHLKTTRTINRDYLFLQFLIDRNAPAGSLQINLSKPDNTPITSLDYRLEDRSKMAPGASGLDAADFIYLIFPDRFANGNPDNDRIEGMHDQSLDRNEMFHRHGGDIRGIIDRLDYLEELGVTALWINPLVENNQPKESYHGYAATDLYRIDPRFGSNEEYAELVNACHQRGIKVITDIVYNHWGDRHPLYTAMPDSSWFNFWPEFTRTTYRATTLFDPYVAENDRTTFTDGWFDHHMPDLNQQNPHLANYLIQNSLWTIGHFGVDAFRIDTYAYPDQLFMKELLRRVRLDFPDFFAFGETWVHGTPVQAWFTDKNGTLKPFDSHLESVTDFQLHYAIQDALNQPFGWTQGVSRLYYTLAKDILYTDASRNVTFLDNHDLSRIYSVLGEDSDKLKMAIGFMMTTRGIPSLYYGTEIGLTGFADPDGKVRQDFPGGWPGDAVNKFVASGREADEADIFNYVKQLANYRKANAALFKGDLVHFVPEAGVYVYLRKGGGKVLLSVFNPGEATDLALERFRPLLGEATRGSSIVDDRTFDLLGGTLRVDAKTLLMLELN